VGLYDALDSLVTPEALRSVRHKSDFGALFEWLRTSSLGNEFEPLKDMVRNYIFRTYPLREGGRVLGKPCPEGEVFTIHSAWQELGIQRKRMNRILLEEGKAQRESQGGALRLKESLTAIDVRDISDRIGDRMTSFQARDMLNVSAEMLQNLRHNAILVPKTDALDQVPKYERADLEDLMTRMLSRCQETKPENSFVTIIDAARRLRCPASDIISLILEGKIKRVWCLDHDDGLARIRVNLDELRAALPELVMSGMTKGEASRALRVTYPTINYLIENDHLRVDRVRNPKSRQFIHAVCEDSVATFQTRFETLGQLASRYRRASGPLGCHLEAKGVCPVETPPGISWFYERRGLEQRLRKLGLVTPDEEVAI